MKENEIINRLAWSEQAFNEMDLEDYYGVTLTGQAFRS